MPFRRKGLAFNSIIYFINYIKSKVTGDMGKDINYLTFFRNVENIISFMGLVSFIYTIIKILIFLKEKDLILRS